ncbi:MAG TPA: hypothetical protein VLB76_12230 [Thermoanaerobaculia bacterium]|nr:hypothetical protein [Thermoanaerobaculia bacterium]
MSGRTTRILSRFPAHLEAARPGKRLGAVTEALAGDLDVLAADLAGVRRSHRLGGAETAADLLLLAGLHGLGAAEMALLFRRELALPVLLDALRARVARTAAIHAAGNGTVRALLEGAANALDLDLAAPIRPSKDFFWHAAFVSDRLSSDPAPTAEVIGLEENPLRREKTPRVPRSHGDLFSVLRRGFDARALEVRIFGDSQGGTLGPMLVNRDEGRGIGYLGMVPAGKELLFTADGNVELDGEDASDLAWSWHGACFATAGADTSQDFVFDGPGLTPVQQARIARFATATPAAALAGNAEDPGPGGKVDVPGIEVGETRFAFFVREAHFVPVGPVQELPRPLAAVFGRSVFAPAAGASPPPAAEIELSWIENEAYAVRVLIPERFRDLDAAHPETVLADVATALRRFQPAGVEVRLEFQEKHWVLGDGVLGEADAGDPLAQIRPGMLLWPDPVKPS